MSIISAGNIEIINDDGRLRKIVWNKQLGQRSRDPYLFFIKDGKAIPFKGCNISGICTVVNNEYIRNGKWSSTYYTILLASDCKIFNGLQSWDWPPRIYTGEYESWQDIANYYQCDVESIKEVFEFFSPSEAERITKTENSIKEFIAGNIQNTGPTPDDGDKSIKDTNTRLIAAAPEMYKILKTLYEGPAPIAPAVYDPRFEKFYLAWMEMKELVKRIDGEEQED